MRNRRRVDKRSRIGLMLATAAVASVLVVTATPPTPASAAATLPAGFADDVVASGFTLPTQSLFLPDGRILVAEKDGLIKVVKNGAVLPTPFIDLRTEVNSYWDRGLTSMAVDPNFPGSPYVYIFYPQDPAGDDTSGHVTNTLIRVNVNGDVAGARLTILGSVNTAGCADVHDPACINQEFYGHAADALVFAPDGTLFVTLGDDASWDVVDEVRAMRAQDKTQYNGKVLHINKDGSAVPSNPFYQPGNPGSIQSKVYAYGLRNPFRANLKPGTSTLYVGDVGWNTTEEINVIQPGANYGWPCYEGNAHTGGYEQTGSCQAMYNAGTAVSGPLITWPHGNAGAAGVGGPFTPSNSSYAGAWHGGFFYGDYSNHWIRFAKVDANNNLVGQPVDFATGNISPVHLTFGPDGDLYYVDIVAGDLHRIRPTTGGGGGGDGTYLSDLTPSATPVNGWGPYERDSSNGEEFANDGRTLSLNGVTFAKGLGVNAASELRYSLPGGCTTFTASIGVDDEVGPGAGSVRFEVWNGTATRLYQSNVLGSFQGAVNISVPVTGISDLRLVVDPGADNAADHADWADAQVACTGGPQTGAPTATITSPPVTFKVGDVIHMTGSAVDAQGQPIPDSGLSWQVTIFHCPGGSCHSHPGYQSFDGPSAAIAAPDHGDDSYLSVRLTAIDSSGNSGSVTRRVDPQTVQFVLDTAPSGMTLVYGDKTVTTPYLVTTELGGTRTIAAPLNQNGRTFGGWTDGGGPLHNIVAGTTAPRIVASYLGGTGYWLTASDGGIFNYGDAGYYGSTGDIHLNQPIVTMAPTGSGAGYWLAAADGGIFSYGDATFYGSTGDIHLNQPIVAMTPTPSGHGYWLVARDGGIFNYGDAAFYGSAGGIALARPIVGMTPTPTGHGYWLVASDGGIFAYGDAEFYGSTGGIQLNQPIVGIARTPTGGGYWLAASDGGIFNYGDAAFYGSAGGAPLNKPIVGIAASIHGYWLTASDGGIFNYGDAGFVGSTGGIQLNNPVVGMAAIPTP